jgi:hypothetical protein
MNPLLPDYTHSGLPPRTWLEHRADPQTVRRWSDPPPVREEGPRQGANSKTPQGNHDTETLTEPLPRRKVECVSCRCFFEIRTGPCFDILCQPCFDQQPEVMKMEGGAR